MGSGGMWTRPVKGRSISSIRNIAPATEIEDTTKAMLAVLFGGAKMLKLKKMITSQHTNTAKRGMEMEDMA
jgi:hypothetical protein